MQQIIEKIFAAADQHGEDSGEPDHAVGDLQGMLRLAWDIMTVSQRLQLLRKPEFETLLDAGSRGEFDAGDLAAQLTKELSEMEAKAASAGYRFMEGEGGFFWETDEEASEDFHAREDAVADAYRTICGDMPATAVSRQHVRPSS